MIKLPYEYHGVFDLRYAIIGWATTFKTRLITRDDKGRLWTCSPENTNFLLNWLGIKREDIPLPGEGV